MAERERQARGKPEAERYPAEYVPLPGGAEGASLAALQEAINENARHSWKLISVTQDPTSRGPFLVCGTRPASSPARSPRCAVRVDLCSA